MEQPEAFYPTVTMYQAGSVAEIHQIPKYKLANLQQLKVIPEKLNFGETNSYFSA